MPCSPRFDRALLVRAPLTVVLVFLGAFVSGCKCNRDPAPGASGSASARVPGKPVLAASRCREVVPGKSFEVSGSAAKQVNAEPLGEEEATVDSEDDIPLPFAAELGAVQASSQGFAAGVLRARGHESHAAAVFVEPDAATGKIIELGRVHGDPEPPTLAFHGQNMIAVIPDNDAGGGMLRIGIIRDARGAAQTTYGDDVVSVRRQAGVGGIAVTGERGFIVFVSERKGQASLGIARFDANTGKQVGEPEPLPIGSGEAEAARLLPRKGGFWLSFVRTLPSAKTIRGANSAGAAGEAELILDGGEHTVEVMPLDPNGAPSAQPIALSPPRRHQILFDLATLPNGDALVALRGDDTAPGAESGGLSLVRVRVDGSKEQIPVPGEKFEAGGPSLLVDAEPKTPTAPSVWLAATGERNATWFAAISPNGSPTGPLQADTIVRGAALLAVQRGNILIGRSKGTSIELSAIECRPEPLAPLASPSEETE